MWEYNLFNGVRVEIDQRLDWALELMDMFPPGDEEPSSISRIRLEHVEHHDTGGTRELEIGVRIGRDWLYDEIGGVVFDRPDESTLRLRADRPAVEWLMWGLQLATIRNKAAFVHCAAVEKDGRAVLFPSWGGVGKTALVAEFIRKFGWRLLGDDMVVVSRDGKVHAFPKWMVLYPYHRSLFPEVFSTGEGPIAPTFANGVLTRVAVFIKPVLRRYPKLLQFARRHNPQSARIAPKSVFGSGAIANEATLNGLVWLERLQGASNPELVDASEGLTSRIIGSTMNEYEPRCVRLTNTAMGLGVLNLDEYIGSWTETISEALAGRPQHLLYIPAEAPVIEVPRMAKEAMESTNLWIS